MEQRERDGTTKQTKRAALNWTFILCPAGSHRVYEALETSISSLAIDKSRSYRKRRESWKERDKNRWRKRDSRSAISVRESLKRLARF